jgi:hypothetical protein
MMTFTAQTNIRELAHRCFGGIEVRLLWDANADGCIVTVVDLSTLEAFEIPVGDRSPMEVLHHPYASLDEQRAA